MVVLTKKAVDLAVEKVLASVDSVLVSECSSVYFS